MKNIKISKLSEIYLQLIGNHRIPDYSQYLWYLRHFMVQNKFFKANNWLSNRTVIIFDI